MPVWLAWSAIKGPLLKAAPWLAAAIGAFLLVLHFENVGARRQAAKDAATIQKWKDARDQLAADVTTATAKALEDDRDHAQAVQAAQDKLSKDKQDDLQHALDAARRSASDYAARLRAAETAANSGRSGGANLPSSADASSAPDGASQTTELDAIACAEGVTKAQGWQDWWKAVEALTR